MKLLWGRGLCVVSDVFVGCEEGNYSEYVVDRRKAVW